MEITLFTNLSREECIKRIKSNATKQGRFSLLTKMLDYGKIIYQLDSNNLVLYRLRYQNIDKPTFTGRLSTDKNGTRIEGHFSNPKLRYRFTYAWIIYVGVLTCVIIFVQIKKYIKDGHIPLENLIPSFGPIFMLLFGVLFLNVIKTEISRDKKYIANFIKSTLEAK